MPTSDELVAVHDALWLLLVRIKSRDFDPLRQEGEILTIFGRLADALRPIRPLVGRCQGWRHKVGRALRVVVEGFDGLARFWGWEPLIQPEPERSALAERLRERWRETAERPLLEAALAYQEGCNGLDFPERAEGLAELARARGMTSSMATDEGRARYPEALARYHTTPVFGVREPSFRTTSEDDLTPLSEAFNALRSEVMASAPERCRNLPELFEELASQSPTARPAPSPITEAVTPPAPTVCRQGGLDSPTPDDLVTLDQAAGIVHKTKRTLEYYKTKGELPEPSVEGGGGKAALYDWRVMRPWLEGKYGLNLPETYPGRGH